MFEREELPRPATAETFRPARPARIAVYGGLALIAALTPALLLPDTAPRGALYAWTAVGVIAVLTGIALAARMAARATDSLHLDEAGVTFTSRAGRKTLRWEAIAELRIIRRGALELSDANRFVVVPVSRNLERFPVAVAEVMARLEDGYTRRASGARSRPIAIPKTYSSSVLPETLEALLVCAATASAAWWNLRVFLGGLLGVPATMYRLSRVPYAITVGPLVRLDTLAWTYSIPVERVAAIQLTADERGRPRILLSDADGGSVIAIVSRLKGNAIDLYDRLRRLHEARAGTMHAAAATTRLNPVPASCFAVACLLVAAVTLAQPLVSGALLRFAAERGQLTLVERLLALGAVDRMGTDRVTALYLAARSGHRPIVQLLLARGADPVRQCRDPGFTPLHVAAEHGHVDIVRDLLAVGVDPDVRNYWQQTPLWQASWHVWPGDVAVATVLLDGGASIDAADQSGWTPLHQAARHGNLPLLKFLVARGASLGARTKNGHTPIETAALRERADSLRAFVEAGVDLNALNANGYTLLRDAVAGGELAVVRAVLDAGGRPEVAGTDGYNSMQLAAWNGSTEVLRLLLERGANPNLATDRQPPPIILAAHRGHLAAVSVLAEHGADINFKYDAWTALRAAESRGHMHVVQYVVAHGGQR